MRFRALELRLCAFMMCLKPASPDAGLACHGNILREQEKANTVSLTLELGYRFDHGGLQNLLMRIWRAFHVYYNGLPALRNAQPFNEESPAFTIVRRIPSCEY
ncbi:hypothetical protein CJF30_00010077 [Rutstroemia sp. NJR-2017a BBW]|nr:hypothetical protein CJF30_00010077 [Rutstroemia sp. NJR-2017a BBW]